MGMLCQVVEEEAHLSAILNGATTLTWLSNLLEATWGFTRLLEENVDCDG